LLLASTLPELLSSFLRTPWLPLTSDMVASDEQEGEGEWESNGVSKMERCEKSVAL
jgi:hypothetical protein